MTRAVQPVRPAATVILVRDAVPHFEVLMLKRTRHAAFAGGRYVFPGGRVDGDDHLELYARLSRGPGERQAHQIAAIGHEHLEYWVAAVRECFEEAGILLAYDAQGRLLTHADPRIGTLRGALNAGRISFDEVCRELGVKLALDRVHYYDRWVTPYGRPRRFDTRFFIALAPDAQAGSHDETEVVDSVWLSPREALARHAAGEFALMRVTERQLARLSEFERADELVAMVESIREFKVNRPELPPGDPDAPASRGDSAAGLRGGSSAATRPGSRPP